MTEAISVRAFRPAESRLIAGVCAAHMMSHYYMLMLAPLFAIIRADFNVSYTELALALTVFNVVSGVLQTPVGFLVDRIGARVVLIAGLALSTIAYAVAGMVGSAIAPVTLLYMQSQFGWRGAYVGASIFGLLVLLALIAQPEPAPDKPRAAKSFAKTRPGVTDAGWRLLLSPPILLNLAYFVLTSIMSGGLNTYLVVALGALHGTPAAVANMALTALLAMNAVGVLVGGVLAGRTSHHAAVAASGLAIGGTVTALIGWFALPSAGLILLMAFSGLCVGVTMPSRDMLVRSVTPPNAYGRVFGFVSMGFNIGASVAPIVYGALMDRGQPLMVFMLSAAVCIICISTVTFGFAGRETR